MYFDEILKDSNFVDKTKKQKTYLNIFHLIHFYHIILIIK